MNQNTNFTSIGLDISYALFRMSDLDHAWKIIPSEFIEKQKLEVILNN